MDIIYTNYSYILKLTCKSSRDIKNHKLDLYFAVKIIYAIMQKK